MEQRNMITEVSARTIRDDSYTSQLIEKWNRQLRGVNEEYTRRVMAMLYENQWLDMQRQLREDTLATNAGIYTKYIFPVLRRVFPNLIANEVVSVQPMTAPVGAVFYFDRSQFRRLEERRLVPLNTAIAIAAVGGGIVALSEWAIGLGGGSESAGPDGSGGGGLHLSVPLPFNVPIRRR